MTTLAHAQTAPAASGQAPTNFGTVAATPPTQPTVAAKPTKPKPDTAEDDTPKAKPRKQAAAKASAPVAAAAATTSVGTGVAGIALGNDAAIGSNAPLKSAPALAPSQTSLNAFEPGSVVSDKVLRDVVLPSADYNEAGKFTPGFYSINPNGPLGDSKSGWRGFADGQFNITFDGIPFGDANDPSHHSAAYFPGPFLGGVVIDRGPGAASQVGYATFGGTMALSSRDLTDRASSSVTASVGNYGTYTGSATTQTGLVNNGQTRALFQYAYAKTDGAIVDAHVDTSNFLFKLDQKLGDGWKATLFSTYGRENYNNTSAPNFTQLNTFGKTFSGLNNDPTTEQFTGYNNSQKRTDLDYFRLEGKALGWHIDNKVYTYAYDYPKLQNNGNDQTIIGPASLANGGTVNTLSITNPASSCGGVVTCKTTITFAGVKNGDVTGYLKNNNFRGYGDIIDGKKDIDAGFLSGQLRTGFWWEHVDNHRSQEYYDYTQGQYYDALSPSITKGGTTAGQNAIDLYSSAYKLNLNSHINNIQAYSEYEWKPIAGLSITPGIKHEEFNRIHDAAVNQTTLQPAELDKTYYANLPFLSARYKLTPEATVYAQASKGFLAPTVSAYYVYDFSANNIQPEITDNYQTGISYKSRQLTWGADVYRIVAQNFPITTTFSDGTSVYMNAGTARYQGIEGQATYAFGNGLAAYTAGSLSDATFIAGQSTGLAVPNAPRATAIGGFLFDDGHYFGSLLHKYTGGQYGSSGQIVSTATVNGDLNKISAYQSTDIVAGVRSDFLPKLFNFGKTAEVKFGVVNIFNNRGIVDISGAPKTLTPDAAGNTLTYTSQAGRVIYLGSKFDF